MGILDTLLSQRNLDNLALGFNSMRLNPDQNLPDMIARRQALRREEGNRQKAIDYFKNVPNSEAYIGALNAGGSGANLIANHIADLQQRARDERVHKQAMARAAANRPAPVTVEMTTMGALQEAGLMPKGVVVSPNMMNMPVKVSKRDGQVVDLKPIQMPTAAKTSETGIFTVQQLMESGAIGKGAAQQLAQNPNALYEVTKENGRVTSIDPFTTQGDTNKTIAMLEEAAKGGDLLAESALTQLRADPNNASTILRNYYTTKSYVDRDKMTVKTQNNLGNGLVELIMKSGDVFYKENGIILNDPEKIKNARTVAKNLKIQQKEDEAAAKAQGKNTVEKVADIDTAIQGMNNSIAVAEEKIKVLMTHPGLQDATGQVNGLKTKLTTSKEGAEFITLYDELAGQIFLSAFEKLKGGGPITDLEGQKAQQAASNLDRQLDPDSFRRALNTFYNDLRASHARLVRDREILLAGEGPAALPPAVDFNLEPDF